MRRVLVRVSLALAAGASVAAWCALAAADHTPKEVVIYRHCLLRHGGRLITLSEQLRKVGHDLRHHRLYTGDRESLGPNAGTVVWTNEHGHGSVPSAGMGGKSRLPQYSLISVPGPT